VRDLAQPSTLRGAGIAAGFTTLACLPRLWLWWDRPFPTGQLVIALAVCSFVLWAFVFAWAPPVRQPILGWRVDGLSWLVATVGGGVGALALTVWIDPRLREIVPDDYPDSLSAWMAGTLFTLSFVQLFVTFAPFCFFYRLLRTEAAAIGGTILFGLFLLTLQLQRVPEGLGMPFASALLGLRLGVGLLTLFLFLRGGPWAVGWCALLVQARLLPGLF
jgi:hypothetical protein